MKTILLVSGTALLGYMIGYNWRAKNIPNELENFMASIVMPIMGLVFIAIGCFVNF